MTYMVTVHYVHSNLVKIHSKSPSVMGFCHIHGKTPRGILPVHSNLVYIIYHNHSECKEIRITYF